MRVQNTKLFALTDITEIGLQVYCANTTPICGAYKTFERSIMCVMTYNATARGVYRAMSFFWTYTRFVLRRPQIINCCRVFLRDRKLPNKI